MLASLKGESLADVVIRIRSKIAKKLLTNFAGTWIMGYKEEREIFGKILELWRKLKRICLDVDFLVALLRGLKNSIPSGRKFQQLR